jgi:secondary thiamine-phosphate synthase enzyme
VKSITLTIATGSRASATDITGDAASFVADKGDGLLNVFVPHATAGVAVFETGAGSDLDVLDHLDAVLPRDDRWRHSHGSPGHGADHVMPAFIAPSVSVPVLDGVLALGTWQSIVLIDPNRDNPTRSVRLSFIAG